MLRERRRAGDIRLPVRLPALVDEDEREAYPIPGLTTSLSMGGALLQLRKAELIHAAIRMTLWFPRHDPLARTGLVVWTRPHAHSTGWDLGVRFDEDLPREVLAEIAGAEYPFCDAPL